MRNVLNDKRRFYATITRPFSRIERYISQGKVLLEHQKFAYSPGIGAESFKFLRKRPRAHAGKTQAIPAEESLKND